jgi:hypothetical protein
MRGARAAENRLMGVRRPCLSHVGEESYCLGMAPRPRPRAIGILGLVVVAALAGLIIYAVVFREASPGPGWIKVGSVADIERQGVTKVDDSAYVVSYRDLPVFAFAASYVDGIHKVVSYCPSSGWFYNEPHATQYNIVGRYMLGPAPSSLSSPVIWYVKSHCAPFGGSEIR